jgi:hypothetical protein
MANNKGVRASFFFDRFQNYFKEMILQPKMTPERVALSFAIGLAVAFSPFIGLHTCITIAICIVFNTLHRPLMLLTCYINNPWTILPVASVSVLVGNWLMGYGIHLNVDHINWHTIGLHSFTTQEGLSSMYLTLKPVLVPYLLGGFALSILALPLGYYIMLKITRHLRSLDKNKIETKLQ